MSHESQVGDVFTDEESGLTFKIVDDEDFNHGEDNITNADKYSDAKRENNSQSDSNGSENVNNFSTKKISNCRISDDEKKFVVALSLPVPNGADHLGVPIVDLRKQLSTTNLLQEKLGKSYEIPRVPMSLISIVKSDTGAMSDTDMILCDEEASENNKNNTSLSQDQTDTDVYYMVVIKPSATVFNEDMTLLAVADRGISVCEEYIYTHRPHQHPDWDSIAGAKAFAWIPNLRAAFINLNMSHVLDFEFMENEINEIPLIPGVSVQAVRNMITRSVRQREREMRLPNCFSVLTDECSMCLEDFEDVDIFATKICGHDGFCRHCAFETCREPPFNCAFCHKAYHPAATQAEYFAKNFFCVEDVMKAIKDGLFKNPNVKNVVLSSLEQKLLLDARGIHENNKDTADNQISTGENVEETTNVNENEHDNKSRSEVDSRSLEVDSEDFSDAEEVMYNEDGTAISNQNETNIEDEVRQLQFHVEQTSTSSLDLQRTNVLEIEIEATPTNASGDLRQQGIRIRNNELDNHGMNENASASAENHETAKIPDNLRNFVKSSKKNRDALRALLAEESGDEGFELSDDKMLTN